MALHSMALLAAACLLLLLIQVKAGHIRSVDGSNRDGEAQASFLRPQYMEYRAAVALDAAGFQAPLYNDRSFKRFLLLKGSPSSSAPDSAIQQWDAWTILGSGPIVSCTYW